MGKTVVIYQSKYGTTKQYAEWISQALGCELFEGSKFKPAQFDGYDTVIYGGALYAGGTMGVSLISKNFDRLKNKKVAVFTVGLGDPNVPENVKAVRVGLDKVFDESMRQQVRFFHLRGGMDYAKLGVLHRSMMGMVRSAVEKKDPATRTVEDHQMLETFGKTIDFTDRQTIQPILDFANS